MRNSKGFLMALVILVSSCSSAPKRPAEIFNIRNMTQTQLDLANRAAEQGDNERGLVLLEEARRLAVSADDPAMLIRTGLARGNMLHALGRFDEADKELEAALAEAAAADDKELTAVVRIHSSRDKLRRLSRTPPVQASALDEIKNQVTQDMGAIKNDQGTIALGWDVIGLAEKEGGRFAEAEAALKKALAIHEKDLRLEQAAYDWFLIASVHSVAGRYDAALEALRAAIAFDRRAENSYGLASDWYALGEVCKKANRSAEAAAAFDRSAAIFRSMGKEAPR